MKNLHTLLTSLPWEASESMSHVETSLDVLRSPVSFAMISNSSDYGISVKYEFSSYFGRKSPKFFIFYLENSSGYP